MSYVVRSTVDRAAIYAFLRRDPLFTAYAIGDLEPPYFEHSTWLLASQNGSTKSLALLYQGLKPPVLMTLGETAGVAAIFDHLALPPQAVMSAPAAHLPLFQAAYDFSGDRIRPMLRMSIAPPDFRPAGFAAGSSATLRRLGPPDGTAIAALFATGDALAPDAYDPSQLEHGVFYGVEVPKAGLVAVAGTHLVVVSSLPAPSWPGIAAVGNVYTHPARRGRSYGQAATSAVTAELLARGLLVVLNVGQENEAAWALYRKLGYQEHYPYFEGLGRLKQPATIVPRDSIYSEVAR